ncbi:DUF6538 domain-containing protein [Halorhodospira neutriphila]|uniref:DUF6538 domain-containing protein n=1 Tax=Halorhodospira neutriphila TaxID=168379 RepID=A0ABS1E5A3_9GAMM|nr:DUF6538 domain-containing protein [Halorhodospira neutriphila]MBK1726362.1 hypothetical protein [Halorhodospira neutriphila]
MTRPYRHRKTGIFWVRKAVPAALRETVGRRELKESLRTRDPTEAKQRASAVLQRFEAILAAAREGQRYGPEELQGLAGEYYRQQRAAFLQEAQRQGWSPSEWDGEAESHDAVLNAAASPDQEVATVRAWGRPRVERLLDERGELVPLHFRDHLAESVYRAHSEALADAAGEHLHFREPPRREYPEPPPSPEVRSLSGLFERYAECQGVHPRTRTDWGKRLQHFEAWLEHKPAHRVTAADVQRYADALRSGAGPSGKPLAVKTVNEGYLVAVHQTFAWAVKRGLLATNPAQGVSVEGDRGKSRRKVRGYSREEAACILAAARGESVAYKRWVPWLLAFTGARIGEILWRTKADVQHTEGVYYLDIREQVKNQSSVRCVPLHSALIAEGFLEYWRSLPDGEYLFPGEWSDQHGDRTKTPANRLRDWINKRTPVADAALSPNHSFRHRLISECRRAGIDGDQQRQLAGHYFQDEHARYGPGEVPTLSEALERIPSPLGSP